MTGICSTGQRINHRKYRGFGNRVKLTHGTHKRGDVVGLNFLFYTIVDGYNNKRWLILHWVITPMGSGGGWGGGWGEARTLERGDKGRDQVGFKNGGTPSHAHAAQA